MEYYPFNEKVETVLLKMKVRSSIFTITGVCAGLPALVWSVSDLIHHRKNGHRISIFIILLLLTDFIELFLSPYILIKALLGDICSMDWTCWIFGPLWWASRDCGLLLNQLVALEGILSIKYPLYSASVFSSSSFRNFYKCVFLCITVSHVFSYTFFVIVSMFIASVIIWIISCGASCSPDRHSHTSRKPDGHILFVFIFSLLIYIPLFLLNSLFIFNDSLSLCLHFPVCFIPVFLISLRLISDPLLCVLVCRQNLRTQTSQKPEGF